jgi:hypothetical protein
LSPIERNHYSSATPLCHSGVAPACLQAQGAKESGNPNLNKAAKQKQESVCIATTSPISTQPVNLVLQMNVDFCHFSDRFCL